jgi:ADP-ribosylglycohydrolase
MPLAHDQRMALALDSLTGLSVGDAFGDQFFSIHHRGVPAVSGLPPAPWKWSDDTEMACSIIDVLNRRGRIDQDDLARCFAERYDVRRRYGAGALELMDRIRRGDHWHRASRELFDGRGSYGNGGAMRAAPLGAYFCDDLARAAEEAALSAEVTHANPEGIAGAVAVAVASAHAAAHRGRDVAGASLIEAALAHVTTGEHVRRGLERALTLLGTTPFRAAQQLGNGSRISAQDTVPYTLWAAATHLTDYEAGVRACPAVGGDMDTTAAIVGGIIAAHLGEGAVPPDWLRFRGPLPVWLRSI